MSKKFQEDDFFIEKTSLDEYYEGFYDEVKNEPKKTRIVKKPSETTLKRPIQERAVKKPAATSKAVPKDLSKSRQKVESEPKKTVLKAELEPKKAPPKKVETETKRSISKSVAKPVQKKSGSTNVKPVPSSSRTSISKVEKPKPGISQDPKTSKSVLKKPEPKIVKTEKDAKSSTESLVSRQNTFVKDSEKVSKNDSESEFDYESDFEDPSESESVDKKSESDEIPSYDDDFESYESDGMESGFTSPDEKISDVSDEDSKNLKVLKPVEEERKMDSGSYDLSVKKAEIFRTNQLKEIEEAISRENTLYTERPSKNETNENNGFRINKINFRAALQSEKGYEKRNVLLERGRMLLSMVMMHPMSFHLFEMAPTPYSEFIRMYGKKNNLQVYAQTNDDAISAEVQTEAVLTENKWTQWPIEYHRWTNTDESLALYLHDRNGVGSDNMYESLSGRKNLLKKYNYNLNNLNNFVISAGKVMLVILEEEAIESKTQTLSKGKTDFGFSEGFISMTAENINFLKGRPITHLVFSPFNPLVIMSCHQSSPDFGANFIDQYYGRCILCIWDVLQPSSPLKLLVASDEITSTCFDASYDFLVYAGLNDGTICVWDLSERTEWHQQNIAVEMPFVLRTPTYCTFYNDNDEKHNRTIKSLKSAPFKVEGPSGMRLPTKLISMGEDSKCVIWTVQHVRMNDSLDLVKGENKMSPWGKVKLVFNSIIDPRKNLRKEEMSEFLELNCMALTSKGESLRILFGTNIGYVLKCIPSGRTPSNGLYGYYDTSLNVTCIETCPYLNNLFLAATDDGNVSLYDFSSSNSLRTYAANSGVVGSPVTHLKWSTYKIGMFFVLDEESNLHVWDLCQGDFFPKFTTSMKKSSASCIDVSNTSQFPYLAVATKKSEINVHKIKEDLLSKDKDAELKLFEYYVHNCNV